MCIVCVNVSRLTLGMRDVVSLVLSTLLAIVLMVPEAAAARKERQARGGYSPPYASLVYDVNSGRILQETNATALRHPASVTKVMTLYMLFEQLERGRLTLSTELPVSDNASRQAPSKLSLHPGDTIAVEDAIKALVTKSANDVAVVVAEAIGGDEQRFAEMMTQKARSIGMNSSTFRNASGLPNPAQVTTARDLATLGQAIQDRFPKYYGYFGTRTFTYDGDVYRNHNRLLGVVEGVDGIKTGYTRASGFNLLTSAKLDGRHIITVVLGGRSARARDVAVASLVQEHLPVAVAGRRTTAKVIDVATAREEDESTPRANTIRMAQNTPATAPARQPAQEAKLAPQATAAPANIAPAVPAARPRPAVIAETGREPVRVEAGDNSLTRTRPPVLSAMGGATGGSTTALALMETNPRQPQMRWVQGSAGQPVTAGANRPVPPGNVRYTNSTTPGSIATPVDQPMPVSEANTAALPGSITGKNEQRLNTPREGAKVDPTKAEPAPTTTNKTTEPVRAVAEAPKAKATAAPVPARSGWVIQLAAAESETKARGILDSAIVKNAGILKTAEPFTEAVTKGESTFFRARFAGFEASEAQNACKALKRSGFNCFAQKI